MHVPTVHHHSTKTRDATHTSQKAQKGQKHPDKLWQRSFAESSGRRMGATVHPSCLGMCSCHARRDISKHAITDFPTHTQNCRGRLEHEWNDRTNHVPLKPSRWRRRFARRGSILHILSWCGCTRHRANVHSFGRLCDQLVIICAFDLLTYSLSLSLSPSRKVSRRAAN